MDEHNNKIKIDKLVRSKRKTIALMVSADATLVVRAPMRTALEYIESLVFAKRFWIAQKKRQILANGGLIKKKQFIEGEGFLFLGNIFQLKIHDEEIIKITDQLYFPEIYLPRAKLKMITWYQKQALEKITERAMLYSQTTGWKYRSLALSNAKRQWGSCKSSGAINFSWKLIMAPLAVIDYVVVHELAHLIEPNHSARFWRTVQSILPDYQVRRQWLKDQGKTLTI